MRRLVFHFLLIVLLSLTGVGCYSPPASNSLVGNTEATVLTGLGKPSTEWLGHYGLPPLEWTRRFSGEVKSATFTKRGGKVYVTYENRDGMWYVIKNSWLRDGAAF